jgi:serine phosphatase RsbU (regulator of sigma subunit)
VRFRLRLALIFVLLSALPLTLLAVYSFTRSSGALRRAVEAEAQLMARDLEHRVGTVATDVDRRIRDLARLPTSFWLSAGGEEAKEVDPKVLSGFAEALPFIENFRFVPRAAGQTASAGSPGASPGAGASFNWAFRTEPGNTEPAHAPQARVAPMSEEQIDAAMRSAEAGARLAKLNLPPNMPEAEREKLSLELEKVRVEVARSLAKRDQLRRERGRAPVAPAPPPAPEPAPVVAEARPAVSPAAPSPAPAAPRSPGHELSSVVRDNGEVVGEITGKLKAKEILRSVLTQTEREQGEIPFALDDANQLYVSNDADGEKLKALPAVRELRGEAAGGDDEEAKQWIVVAKRDEATGLRFGIARPISRAMKDLKTHTALNFLAAFFLIGATTVGMIPLTAGMVKNVRALEEGAARIAAGDLTTRVPITSRDEFGHLARSFNHMALELSEHQERLLEQERIGKEREIERRLLEAQNDRKSRELEEARRFQLSLLPRRLPERPGLELGVAMSTATEVGGDYYDFRESADGTLLVAVGDATGHGAAAGTMVTVVKSLFMAGGPAESPGEFLRRATGLVHGMGLSRMAMALTLARVAGRKVLISSAGMPPALHFRAASGEVSEITLPGMPLGARAEFAYEERELELAPGDALLLMSDGFPELANARGDVLGYERAGEVFAGVARRSAPEIVAALESAAAEWAGALAPSDDVTFLVLRAT